MKIVRFRHNDNISFGEIREERITGIDGSPFINYKKTGKYYSLDEVKLLPPVVPSKIVCIGMNYSEHIAEIGAEPPEEPFFFLKPPSSLIGHGDAIILPQGSERVDYEGELAVIIKDKMKNVVEDKALDYVLGYSCFNDVTERFLLMKDIKKLTMAKGFDTFSAFGPCITRGLDPNNLDIKTYLNGSLMQHDNTKNCVFSVQYILYYVSQCMTLYPGDVVITGTPKGVASMRPGDVIEIEVEGVGMLRNIVKDHEAI